MPEPSTPAALLLEDAFVLTCDAAGTAGALSVVVVGDRVAAVGPAPRLRARFAHAERISCAGRILMPGLVNAHLHPDLHLLKGEVEDLGLHDWSGATFFNAAISLLDTDRGNDLQRASIRASLAEAVLGGTTTIGTYGISDGAAAECARALGELGVHGHITIRDAGFTPLAEPPGVPHMYRLHAEEKLDHAELAAAMAAHARGERIVMHAAETAQRVALVRERFGTTTIHLLQQRGLLSPRMLLSHAIHIDRDEIAAIARTGTGVVVSPAAEMKLADGVPPAVPLLRAGVPVALGTDAAVCNNGTDMFLEMRALGLSQKLRYGADAISAEQILLMATRLGAAALGEGATRGSLAEGMAADLILVNARSPRLQPLVTDAARPNVAANLVYAATAADVTDVMAGGRWIVRRRRLLTLEQRRALRDLAAAARQLHTMLRNA